MGGPPARTNPVSMPLIAAHYGQDRLPQRGAAYREVGTPEYVFEANCLDRVARMDTGNACLHNRPMDVAYVSALSALGGSIVGGLISGTTTWLI
jgi:hypothetical protein